MGINTVMPGFKIRVPKVLIQKEEAVLVAVDFQERLFPAMEDNEALGESAVKLIRGIRTLDVPILVTQQYTKGLGSTIPEIAQALGAFEPIEKIDFSAAGEQDFLEALNQTEKKTVILCGIEAHVCVAQTALQLLAMDYRVYLVEDAIASRKKKDKEVAFQRLIQRGAIPVTVESVLFELLQTAQAAEFKEISRIVK